MQSTDTKSVSAPPSPGRKHAASANRRPASREDVVFPARYFLWKMTEVEKAERDAARNRILERFRLPPEFLLGEMYSPSPPVRVEALRLLEQCLPLGKVSLLLPLLQDYSVDVREQARRTIGTIVNRYASDSARMSEEVRDADSLKNLLETFAALLQTTDIVSGGTVVDVLVV